MGGWRGRTGLGRVPEIHGHVSPGWEKVRAAFEENFRSRNELGASFCLFHKGEKVVDIWAGESHDDGSEWQADTLVNIFSTTKGLSALCLLMLQSRRLIEWDAPVARYWPEFAQQGKAAITVRQLMSHEAGLAQIDRPLTVQDLADWQIVGSAIAETKPFWETGTKHGYMGLTLGYYMDQLVRRVDPKQRSVSQFIQQEVVPALGLPGEFFLGLPSPAKLDRQRVATFNWLTTAELVRFGILGGRANVAFMKAYLFKRSSYSHQAFKNPAVTGDACNYNLEEVRALEIPAANGHATARFVAANYNAFVTAQLGLGNPLGFSEAALAEMREPSGKTRKDETLLLDTRYSHGFARPNPDYEFGSTDASFGTPGAGGSFGFADAKAGIAFAYLPRLGNVFQMDPRELALRQAVYDVVGGLGGPTRKQPPAQQLKEWLFKEDELYFRSTWSKWLGRRFACSACAP